MAIRPSLLRTIHRIKRKAKQYRLNRKRSRVARRKQAGTRKATVVLALILIALFGAFAWSQSYLTTPAQGRELSMGELRALGEEHRISDAIFFDEDNRLGGTFVADPIIEEETKKDPKGEDNKKTDTDGKRSNEPNGNAGANDAGDDKKKAGDAKKGKKAEESIAPPGTGTFWLGYPSSDAAFGVLSDILDKAGAHVTVDAQSSKTVVRVVSTYLLPLLILANFFGLLFTAGRGGTSGIGDVIAFGVMGNKRQKKGFTTPVTFGDVGGAEEAVAELREVVDYLRDPDRYEELKAAPPKGVLLFGPPGCGKTLMAKAVAGEAGVPFFSVAGAEFVESLVGVGAARVRDLFQQVRQVAPAIVFIDELDAAGRKRGSGSTGGGSDEREQTLNQLLVEMDGFGISAGIVVIGATNRPDILDPALLRPGRFDRHITVEQPDVEGREEVLLLHARGKPFADDVDWAYLARRTPGFSGADLANVINEAALLTVRAGHEQIHLAELEEGVQRVLHGPKRKGRMLSAEERGRVAYHECGHAVVAAAIGDRDDVHRISVLDRGRGLGSSAIQRQEESILTADQLYEKLVITMGGMASEKLVLGQPSTGVESDLEEATSIARDMVARFGLSELGSVRLVSSDVDVFLGNASAIGEVSEATLRRIDAETRRFVESALEDAATILEEHRSDLDALVERLLEQETLEGSALVRALEKVAPTPVRFPAHTGSPDEIARETRD